MQLGRREFLTLGAALGLSACGRFGGLLSADVLMWGGEGLRDGSFLEPRAICVRDGLVYVIDTTGRIQVFTPDGQFVRLWKTPDATNGTPTDISFGLDGRVLIADTHYSRILEYNTEGELLDEWGAYGSGEREFIYPTGVVQSPEGLYFVSEYGENADRVHVFDADRAYVRQWGSLGDGLGQFSRAMAIDLGGDGLVYVADMSNHRVQVFQEDGTLVRSIGIGGTAPGELKYPFDIEVASDGSILACEYGAHRVSRFMSDGTYVASFGEAGRSPGAFDGPRGVAISEEGFVFVADTGNHRIQRFSWDALT